MKTLLSSAVIISTLFIGCANDTATKAPQKHSKSKMQMFQTVPMKSATLLQSGEQKAFCVNCGMNLPMFYKTNHSAKVDGKTKQYCSIHCLEKDLIDGKNPSDIKVVDTNTLKFIDAKSAFYVLGSNKKGTMSGVSKYAFSTKQEAEKFIKENGGKIGTFEDALELSKKDFSPQMMSKMKKKKAMMAKKGEEVYKSKCKQTSLPKFTSVAKAKAYITKNGVCSDLKGKPLQMVGLYLFSK